MHHLFQSATTYGLLVTTVDKEGKNNSSNLSNEYNIHQKALEGQLLWPHFVLFYGVEEVNSLIPSLSNFFLALKWPHLLRSRIRLNISLYLSQFSVSHWFKSRLLNMFTGK
jgi:hypothetical protein